MPPPPKPTPKGEANLTATRASGKDATQGEKTPVPATQDSAGDGHDTAPSEGGVTKGHQPHDSSPTQGGNAQGVPSGMLDQDHDGVAETPEEGQEHAASSATPARQPRADPRNPKDREIEMSGDKAKHDDKPTDQSSGSKPTKYETPPASGDKSQVFEEACDCVAGGIKKLTDAGMGGTEAGKLALEIWKEMY